MRMSKEFTNENFKKDVLESKKPVLVDFWAEWCGPCQMQGPIVEKVAEKFKDRAVVGKLDVEVAGDIAQKYGVMNIPTLMIFKNGAIVERLTGLRKEAELVNVLEKHVKDAKA